MVRTCGMEEGIARNVASIGGMCRLDMIQVLVMVRISTFLVGRGMYEMGRGGGMIGMEGVNKAGRGEVSPGDWVQLS